MLQVTELLKLIKEQKDMGVSGVSVIATMYKRRIMPLQKRCRFGFEYLGSNDPSLLTAEVLPSETALDCVRRVLLDANTVPYVPKLFSVANPAKPGHVELYRCPVPDPDVPRADHLKPMFLKKSGKESSSSLEVPSHPTKPRAAVRKRKLVLGGASDDNPSPFASPAAKQSKGDGKAGSVGDDAAPESDIRPGVADPSAVDVSPNPSSSIPASASQAPPKEPAGGLGKSSARGPRLIQLKKMVMKRSSTPSSALSLGEPKDVPATQAPEQGKDSKVAVLETSAPFPPPPPPSPPSTTTNVEKETMLEGAGAERVEVDPPSQEIPEGELPKELGAEDVSAAGASDPGTSIAKTASTSGPRAGDAGAAGISGPSTEAANLMDRSQEKSEKLKLMQDSHHQLQEKDRRISEEVLKNTELHNILKQLEAERAREVSVLKNDIDNLEKEKTVLVDKNKKISKAHKDDVECLQKILADTDVQFKNALLQIKDMLAEKNVMQKELEDFKSAAQAVVEMVDFSADGKAVEQSLLEKLRATPQKDARYIAEATKMYISQALALVKSYWPKEKLEPLAEGMAADCSVEQFTKFREEVEPIADKIAESLEQDG